MTETATVPVLWTEKRTEAVMELPPGSLKRDRHRGVGMPYVVLTKRRIRYKADDVAAFITARTVTPEGSAVAHTDQQRD